MSCLVCLVSIFFKQLQEMMMELHTKDILNYCPYIQKLVKLVSSLEHGAAYNGLVEILVVELYEFHFQVSSIFPLL